MGSYTYSKWRLFFTGIAMGVADLIPGISGGTIALMCGIYEPFLENIKTLQLKTFTRNLPFLLPLFFGIAFSIFLFSRPIYFLLLHFKPSLFGFFFGMIAASTLSMARQAKMRKSKHYFACFMGGAVALLLTSIPFGFHLGSGLFPLICAGMVGTAAMLLPGISGSFVLQMIGVYPLILSALNTPTSSGSLKLLIALGIGVSLGFIFFSRLISFLLKSFQQMTLAILIGFMAGGLKALFPFNAEAIFSPALAMILGFLLIIIIHSNKLRSENLKTLKN
jgi:putative membrane protein